MANTIRFQVTQKELNDESTVISETEFILTNTYTVSTKDTFDLASGNVWQTISMGRVDDSTCVVITTDETITIRLSSGTEVFEVQKGMIFMGEITSLLIKNNSGNTATISINIYGN